MTQGKQFKVWRTRVISLAFGAATIATGHASGARDDARETLFTAPPGCLKVLHWTLSDDGNSFALPGPDLTALADSDVEIATFSGGTDLRSLLHLYRVLRREKPDIVQFHGDSPTWVLKLARVPVVVADADVPKEARAALLYYENRYDATVTRSDSWLVRICAPIHMAKLFLYKRSIYRDYEKARMGLAQRWVIGVPPGQETTAAKQSGEAPAHWATETVTIPPAANAIQWMNDHALTHGDTIVTIVSTMTADLSGDFFANVRQLVREEKAIAVPAPLTFTANRLSSHVDPFGPDDLNRNLLPSGKSIVILEPHADDAFLSMGRTMQLMLRKKNRLTLIGLIRENKPNQIVASGLSRDPHIANLEKSAVRRREDRRAMETLYQEAGGQTQGLAPIRYEVLELGIGIGIGGNYELGHTDLALHTPGAVNQESQQKLFDAINKENPDVLVGIDAWDSHPDHVASGRLAILMARRLAAERKKPVRVWLFRGFSNKREDFGAVAGLATALSTEESSHKERIGTEAYYSQRATFVDLYDKRLRNGWWAQSLSKTVPTDTAEVEGFIQFDLKNQSEK